MREEREKRRRVGEEEGRVESAWEWRIEGRKGERER